MTGYRIRTLFNGTDLQHDQFLVEDEGLIRWVGPEAENPHTCSSTRDLGDWFILPGLIDCHVHLATASPGAPGTIPERVLHSGNPAERIPYWTLQAAENLQRLRSAGVVACRDLAAADGVTLGLQQAQKNGLLRDVPILAACGKALCATGGHGEESSLICDGKEGFIRGTRQVIRDGADVVKIMASGGVNSPGNEPGPPELIYEEIAAVTTEAHRRGRKVAAHCHGYTAIRSCVEAGVDSIEHGVFMEPDLMELMKEQGTFLVPTLSAPYWAVAEGLRREPDNPDHKRSQAIMERHREVVRQCSTLGVPVAMGTDAGCPFNSYEQAWYELVLMAELGMEPLAVLQSATRIGAQLLGLPNLGELKAGKEATFLALEGSPLENMEAVGSQQLLLIKGKPVRGTLPA